MTTVLITGCDYGIGYEFARQFAEAGCRVHAICLQEASRDKVGSLGSDVHFHVLDVSDEKAVSALAEKLKDQPVDMLINNAATFAPDGPSTLKLPDIDEFVRVMKVNAAAPIYVSAAFEEHLAISDKKLLIFIGTRSGSIGDNTSGGHYAYRCSKTALNMAAKSLAYDFADRDIRTVVLHPGSVRSETRKGGQIEVEESVSGMRKVLSDLDDTATGVFLRYDGGSIEW